MLKVLSTIHLKEFIAETSTKLIKRWLINPKLSVIEITCQLPSGKTTDFINVLECKPKTH